MVDVGHKEDQCLLGVLPQVGVLGGLDLHSPCTLGPWDSLYGDSLARLNMEVC